MQLRYETGLTGEQYVRAQAWRAARLERCPNHPRGGCSLARHGTYTRKTPRGTRIARWYCPESHTTISLLPDCLAARLPGELDELEAVVAHAEQAPSLAAAANALRRDPVELPGAMRWVERRVRLVHHVVSIVIGLLAAFAAAENVQAFLPVFSNALIRRGIPQRLYVDNGANYRSRQLALVCAKLGIALIHARPHHPAGKGKIERWFRTVRAAWLAHLDAQLDDGRQMALFPELDHPF